MRWIRDFDTASAEFTPPEDALWRRPFDHVGDELIAHNDLGRWDLVRRGSGDWVFIGWDRAAPAERLWDLAHAVHGLVPMTPRGEGGFNDANRHHRPGADRLDLRSR